MNDTKYQERTSTRGNGHGAWMTVLGVFAVTLGACEGPPLGLSTPALTTKSSALNGMTSVGSGSGSGVYAQGGEEGGYGIDAYGGPNANGVVGHGDGTGHGVVGVGAQGIGVAGEGTWGVYAVGTDGPGLVAIGSAVAAGARIVSRTPATATVRNTALEVGDGDIAFATTNPSARIPVQNTLTPSGIIKAWARLETQGSGFTDLTVRGGLNIGAARAINYGLEIWLASPVAPGCATVVTPVDRMLLCQADCLGDRVAVSCTDLNRGLSPPIGYDFISGAPRIVNIMVFGNQ